MFFEDGLGFGIILDYYTTGGSQECWATDIEVEFDLLAVEAVWSLVVENL